MPVEGALVVEDDRFLRVLGIVLDPGTSRERIGAYADFFAHDEPDFDGYCQRVRAQVGGLFPREVRLVETQDELRAALPGSCALVVESLHVGRDELVAGSALRVVQKFGLKPRSIDTAACADRGIKVLTLRRRANIACAEHAFALMLALARRLKSLEGVISAEQLAAAGRSYRPFDRRHTPGGNYGRFSGTRALSGNTMGIIGFGEIGREIALRANAFGMDVIYHQRTRVAAAETHKAVLIPALNGPTPSTVSDGSYMYITTMMRR